MKGWGMRAMVLAGFGRAARCAVLAGLATAGLAVAAPDVPEVKQSAQVDAERSAARRHAREGVRDVRAGF